MFVSFTKFTFDFVELMTNFCLRFFCFLVLESQQKDSTEIKCRYDWHQTAANIVIAIYAKLYHYEKSTVKLNPVRLAVQLVFPQQEDAQFNLDVELRGVRIRFVDESIQMQCKIKLSILN